VDKLIIPNFHVILIHFPIAMLGAGVMIELFSFLWRRSSFRTAGQWMILLGTLGAIPAVTTGLYALLNVMSHGGEADSWLDLKAGSGFTQTDWNFMRLHIILGASAAALALIAVVTWLASSDMMRKILRAPAMLLLVAAVALMVDGAWHGGEMVFRLGFAVSTKNAPLNVVDNPSTPPQGLDEKVQYYVPQGEIHLLLAGFVFALASVTLGLSIRRALTTDTVIVQRIPPTYVPASADRESIKPISLMQALNDPGDEIPIVPAIPAARFWLLAALVAIGAVATGLWFGDFLLPWPMVINKDHLVRAIHNIQSSKQAREGMHIVFGSSILVLTLILALITRFAPRSRVILSGFGLLLVIAMAGQIWLGVLLTFDGDRGPLARFKTQAEATAPAEEAPAPATQPSLSPPPASTQPITLNQRSAPVALPWYSGGS
jgi:uncharacterized membrane protein